MPTAVLHYYEQHAQGDAPPALSHKNHGNHIPFALFKNVIMPSLRSTRSAVVGGQ